MLPLILMLALGLLLARLPSLPARASEVLDVVVIWVALPALIVQVVPRIALEGQLIVPLATAWGSLVVSALLVWMAGRALGWRRDVLGAAMVVVPLGNTSFLGLAAVTHLLGPEYLGPALVYDQLGSFLGLATWATVVAARFGDGETPSLGEIALRVLRFPPFVALLVGVGLRWVALPEQLAAGLERVLAPLAALLVPLAMLSVGMRLRRPKARGAWSPIVVGLLVRLVVMPAFALAALWGLGVLDAVAGQASVLQSAMPPMVTAGVVATNAGLDEESSAGLVGVGIVVAVLSLPAWTWILGVLA